MEKRQLGSNTASLADYSLFDAIDTIKRMGFSTIELLAFCDARHSIGNLAGFWFSKLSEAEKNSLKDEITSFYGVTVHAPFIDIPLMTYNSAVQQLAIAQICEAIDAASFLNGSLVTIHLNAKTSYQLHEQWDEMVLVSRFLGDYAAEQNVSIGIETGFPPQVDDFVKLIKDIDHDAVGANIDVGHLTGSVDSQLRCTDEGCAMYNENLIELTSQLGGKVYHLHLHDVRASDWRDHRQVGTGIIDFRRLFSVLDSFNYTGLMTFELEEPKKEEALQQSKKYIEDIILTTLKFK
ncbi:TPA: sugar phosphate isomerase/epimerase [Candidatus Poribacteria bacterium]|nr:sugar phosphate isomerase/epimerase [Candidatus Poribacteria bacterium]